MLYLNKTRIQPITNHRKQVIYEGKSNKTSRNGSQETESLIWEFNQARMIFSKICTMIYILRNWKQKINILFFVFVSKNNSWIKAT